MILNFFDIHQCDQIGGEFAIKKNIVKISSKQYFDAFFRRILKKS
jgi:hypothetical protein